MGALTAAAQIAGYLKVSAWLTFVLSIITAAWVGVTLNVLVAATVAGSGLLAAAWTYMAAALAEAVLGMPAKLDQIRAEVRALSDATQQAAQLRAENAELRAIAEAALDQRDAVVVS